MLQYAKQADPMLAGSTKALLQAIMVRVVCTTAATEINLRAANHFASPRAGISLFRLVATYAVAVGAIKTASALTLPSVRDHLPNDRDHRRKQQAANDPSYHYHFTFAFIDGLS